MNKLENLKERQKQKERLILKEIAKPLKIENGKREKLQDRESMKKKRERIKRKNRLNERKILKEMERDKV